MPSSREDFDEAVRSAFAFPSAPKKKRSPDADAPDGDARPSPQTLDDRDDDDDATTTTTTPPSATPKPLVVKTVTSKTKGRGRVKPRKATLAERGLERLEDLPRVNGASIASSSHPSSHRAPLRLPSTARRPRLAASPSVASRRSRSAHRSI